MTMVWLYRGQWSPHDRFQELTPELAARAESEDWGQICEGRDGVDMKPIDGSPHAAADAYYSARNSRSMTHAVPDREEQPPAPVDHPHVEAGGLYDTREMRADLPMKRKPGRPRKTES